VPSSLSVQAGLWATSHGWPSGSTKMPQWAAASFARSQRPKIAPTRAVRLQETDRFAAAPPPTIGVVDDEVVTRELGFSVGLRRRAAFLREIQQVCVELGLGCEIDERRRLLSTRVLVLVRGSREGVDALLDYARISGWAVLTDDALGSALG
jgi:hypothetical protein